jgi:hypothetical protein
MSINSIDPVSSSLLASSASALGVPARKSAPAAASAPAAPAPAATPAAKVSISGVPASVDADDRAMYAQVLRTASGNVNAAMAAVSAQDRSSGES